MNRIKYINPSTGKTAVVKINQPSYSTIMGSFNFWNRSYGVLMQQADQAMLRQGFIRAGWRWATRGARRLVKALARG